MQVALHRVTYTASLLAMSLALAASCSKDSNPSDDAEDDESDGHATGEEGSTSEEDDEIEDSGPSVRLDGGRDAGGVARDAAKPGADGAQADGSLLEGGTAIVGMDAGRADAAVSPATRDAGAGAGAVTAADYEKRGRYTVKRLLNQGAGTIQDGDSALLPLTDSNDPSALTLYFPENAAADERFPLLTFGNGTFCSPTFYDELIEHVVSHGFIVIAANTSSTGSGMQMLQAVEWALALGAENGSPIEGKIDDEHIGAFGHSQGGSGTCNAGLDPRIDAMAPLSGVPINAETAAMIIAMIDIPTFFVTTADEAATATRIEDVYNAVTAPAVYGVTVSGNHDEYTDVVDDPGVPGLTSNDARNSRAAVAAWFDWQLKGKAEARELFVGTSCGFCSGSTWMTMKSKGF